MRPPEGYDGIEVGLNRAFALPVASDWVGAALTSGMTLYNWAAGADKSRDSGQRRFSAFATGRT